MTTQTVESPQEPEAPGTQLAETGGNSATPYVVGGAAVLVAAGGATVLAVRRRGTNRG